MASLQGSLVGGVYWTLTLRLLRQAINKYIYTQDLKLIDMTAPLSIASKDKSCNIPFDVHFNAHGHRIAGEVIAKEILELTQPLTAMPSDDDE